MSKTIYSVSERYDPATSIIDRDGFVVGHVEETRVLEGWEELRNPTPTHWATDKRARREISKDEAEAIACMFAAAPEMFTALDELLEAYPYEHSPECKARIGTDDYDSNKCEGCCVSRARDALAKARGE